MRLIISALLICVSILSASDKIFFTSDPAPSPDGKTIVFVYEGDLWTVHSEGGRALRLTGMTGNESDPVFSPDGKWIAFTGRQDGNANVYIVHVNGGDIKQLTFNDANDDVDSWSWDSKYIYFVSNRYNNMTSYKVSIDGGTPVRIFTNYKNRQHNIAEHPITGEIFFNETWESSIFANRKHYKGDYNPDIESYNFKTNELKKYTTYRGKDMWTTIDKMGNIYFVSDEANGEYNLYTFDGNNKKQLTDFSTSIKRSRINAAGSIIVFEKDYQIFSYDTQTGNTNQIPITLIKNKTLELEQEFKTEGKITNFNVSPDGKKIVFVSRGRMFVSDIKGKFIKEISTDKKERVVEVQWLADNESILYNRTVNGWLNLFIIKVNDQTEKQLTSDEQNNQEINLNSERTKASYFSGRNELRIVDLKSFNSETVVKDEFWALYPTAAYFSPDDKFLVYTSYRNFEQDIFVYDFDNKKSHQITKTGVTESDPFWSPDGKYIYFESDRFKPSYPWGYENSDIFRVALTKIDKDFKLDRFDKLFQKEEKKDSSKPVVKIDYEDLNDRWENVVEKSSNQLSPYVIKKDDETTILYASNHDGEKTALWKTVLTIFEEPKTNKITGVTANNFQISAVKDKYYVLAGGDFYELKLSDNKADKISISESFIKNFNNEFVQMFEETWANLSENYYDENFHGVDWNEMKKRYEKFLPYISSREDLRILLSDMLGELNSSHLGFNSTGDEEKTFYNNRTISTGIVFDNNSSYKVDHVVKDSPMDKEGKDVKSGDVLIAINGKKLDQSQNREYYFTGPFREDEVTLTFERNGNSFDVNVHPISRAEFEVLLYDEWVEGNKKYVEDKSNNRIAYIHMKNMGQGELNNFIIKMTNDAAYKDALILDIRYNRGGNVHDNVLQFLSQKPYLQWKYRGGKLTQQPNFTPAANPIVLLVNAQSLSDAEMTSEGFRQLGLGKIIGTETYRWIIFTSGKSLVDGSFYRLPSWGCYTLDGKDLEMNGVAPDIYVDTNMKDRLENKDPQLDRAIEEIMKEIK